MRETNRIAPLPASDPAPDLIRGLPNPLRTPSPAEVPGQARDGTERN